MLAIEDGLFEGRLSKVAELELKSFNAGPSAVEALFADALDAAYMGPGPAINAFVRSRGRAVRIVSGATEGGAALVVQPRVGSAEQLRGAKVASPQLGNTQDIALRTWLKSRGLRTNLHGGGDVSVVPQENAQTLDTFRLGEIAGAWLPEPWATRLVQEADAKVLVDERNLWPGGRFPTTVLVVRTDFLERRPQVAEALLGAHMEAVGRLNSQREASLRAVNKVLGRETGKPLPPRILEGASGSLTFTTDVDQAAFQKLARNAKALGILDRAGLNGAFDLRAANKLRSSPSPPAPANGA